jgi:prepilin-type processing-associated H-X9-DG protein/prepilin-type N-terminal cleavage/methylation domain-containing protein
MKKFTLIELLVVVAIVGVLASMLLPVLGKSRKKSRQIVCTSQQSQISKAIFMYHDDNELLPSVSHPLKTSRLGWKLHVASYLGMKIEVEEGGKAPFRCPSSDIKTGWINQEAGTAYNEKLGETRSWGYLQVRHQDIEKPTETGFTADSVDGTEWWPASKLLPSQDAVGYRHSSGLNISWADGHVNWNRTVSIQAGVDGDNDYYYRVKKN